MARHPRLELAGGIHHVRLRSNTGGPLFHDDWERSAFLFRLQLVARAHLWRCLGYCLMGNHVHLVLETPIANLGRGMHRLAFRHAQAYHRRHGTKGHVFRDRFGSKLVLSNEYFVQLLRYVADNPVKSHACDDPADWPWSSHAALLDPERPTIADRARVEELLEVWSLKPDRYRRLFEDAPEYARAILEPGPWCERPPLERLLATLEQTEAMRLARRHGYRIAEIAAATGLSVGTVANRTR